MSYENTTNPLHSQIDTAPRNGNEGLVLQTAIVPMTMRRNDTRERSLPSARPIKIAAQIKSGIRFEEHFFDGVTVAFQPTEHLSVEWSFLRIGSRPALARICLRKDAARSSQASRLVKTGILKCVLESLIPVLRTSCSGTCAASGRQAKAINILHLMTRILTRGNQTLPPCTGISEERSKPSSAYKRPGFPPR